MATDSKTTQPEWLAPKPVTPVPTLKVYNSLTRSKNTFTPLHGNRVDWYNCGPTVYDAAHMGHARNYLTQDMIRRILQDYFGYEVNFVMNVTDIEDKIITRAREQYLLANYRESHKNLDETLKKDVETAWVAYFRSKLVNKVLAETETPADGQEWESFDKIVERDATDEVFRKECRSKEEKFGLILTSLVSTSWLRVWSTFHCRQDINTNPKSNKLGLSQTRSWSL